MAITRVGGASGITSATLPAHQVGDFIIGISFRDGNNTAPTIPSGQNWTPFDTTAGTQSNGSSVAYKFATSTSEATGTWSSATSVGFVVYRGVDPTTPISISYMSDANFSGTSTISWNGFTFAVTDGSSWALGMAGHRQVDNNLAGNPPSGMTNIAAASVVDGTDDFAIHDTNGGVTGWTTANKTLSGTNGGVRTRVIEIRAAGGAYTLTAAGGSYALTGTAATLKRALKLSADSGSFALTGTAATLRRNITLTAGAGSFALTGTVATLKRGSKLSAAVGSYSLTGTAATLKAGKVMSAAVGSYAQTGTAASLKFGRLLSASSGSYTLTGTAATLTGPSVSFAIGINFRDSPGYATDAADETYCLGETDTYPTTRGGITFGWETIAEGDMGRDRDNALDRRLAGTNNKTNSGTQNIFRLDLPSGGIYSIRLAQGDSDNDQNYQYLQIQDDTTPVLTIDDTNGTAIGFFNDATGTLYSAANWPSSNTAVTGVTFSSSTLRLVLGSPTPQINTSTINHLYVEAEGTAATLVPDSGVYSITGQAATLKRALKLSAASGSFAQTGTAATLKQGKKLSAASGSYSLTGTAAALTYSPLGSYTLSAGVGSYSQTGTAASLKRALRLAADSGSFTLAGSDASLKRGLKLSAGAATFALTGTAASLLRGRQLVAGTGTFIITGQSTSFPRTRRMVTLSGLYNLTGFDVGFDHSGLAGVSTQLSRSRKRSFGAQARNRAFDARPRDRSFDEQPRHRTFTGHARLRIFEEE